MPTPDDVYTVSRLNREARMALMQSFPLLWIEGEISNFSAPASGHWYFTLKDAEAQVRCCMFRNRNGFLRFKPANGAQVLVQARVGLYEPRGDFQLTVEMMQPAGAGALQRAFEALKQKLAAESLFDADRKQPLPPYPRRLGIISSPTGAALRDILSVLARRYRPLEICLFPTSVQGQAAAGEIVQAIQLANRHASCDVLILARGGGSLEDLWPFNEEIVARAIAASRIPIVSGVGHETDFTIADFVADVRAPTPSAAAELCSPDGEEILAWLDDLIETLQMRMLRRIGNAREKLQWLTTRLELRHPRVQLQNNLQRLDDLEARARHALLRRIGVAQLRLAQVLGRVQGAAPRHRIAAYHHRTALLAERLQRAMQRRTQTERSRLDVLLRALATLSPQATLDRGYALVFDAGNGMLLKDADQTSPGDDLKVLLAKGSLSARVVDKAPGKP